jgi:probable F420-dependent oxidoreductase
VSQTGRRPLKVGVFLWPVEDRACGTVPRWTDVLAMARRVEALGFDSVWLPDHLIVHMPFPGQGAAGAWEGWSLLAALAAATERIELGLLVSCAGFRNPAMVAKIAATVDEISGGRLILGLGAGWDEQEFRAYGYPFDRRVGRFEEALAIIAGLLREGHVDFAGRYHTARDCELRPRGPRPQGPPILVGGSGPRMLRLTARYADAWNRDFDAWNPGVAPYSPEDLAAWQPRIEIACAAVGRDPATLERTASIFVDLPGAPGREGWNALTGPPEALADGLRSHARASFTHAQLWLNTNTVEGIEELAPVLALLDHE